MEDTKMRLEQVNFSRTSVSTCKGQPLVDTPSLWPKAVLCYCRVVKNCNSRFTISRGNGAYPKAEHSFCPKLSIHLSSSRNASFFSAPLKSLGITHQVNVAIGYASLPSALVIETRKSAVISLAAALAAALTLAKFACTNSPALFRTAPKLN